MTKTKSRIKSVTQGNRQTVHSTNNMYGSFVYIVPNKSAHRSKKLIIRIDGVTKLVLSGRQLTSIKRVLDKE